MSRSSSSSQPLRPHPARKRSNGMRQADNAALLADGCGRLGWRAGPAGSARSRYSADQVAVVVRTSWPTMIVRLVGRRVARAQRAVDAVVVGDREVGQARWRPRARPCSGWHSESNEAEVWQ